MSRTLLKIAVALILVALVWRVLLGDDGVGESA
jgi:hypothetical protein